MTRKTLINGLNEMESKEEHAREHVYTRSLIVMPTRGVVFITSTKPEVSCIKNFKCAIKSVYNSCLLCNYVVLIGSVSKLFIDCHHTNNIICII